MFSKHKIIRAIAERADLRTRDVYKFFHEFCNVIIEVLNVYDKVQIDNFGVFYKKIYKSKIGYDFHNKKSMVIPETVRVKFKLSKNFKDNFSAKMRKKDNLKEDENKDTKVSD